MRYLVDFVLGSNFEILNTLYDAHSDWLFGFCKNFRVQKRSVRSLSQDSNPLPSAAPLDSDLILFFVFVDEQSSKMSYLCYHIQKKDCLSLGVPQLATRGLPLPMNQKFCKFFAFKLLDLSCFTH